MKWNNIFCIGSCVLLLLAGGCGGADIPVDAPAVSESEEADSGNTKLTQVVVSMQKTGETQKDTGGIPEEMDARSKQVGSENEPEENPVQPGVFRLFYDNTYTMQGFAESGKDTSFRVSVNALIACANALIDAPGAGFLETTGYVLKADQSNELQWVEVALNEEIRSGFTKTGEAFYTGKGGRTGTLLSGETYIGPLARLCKMDDPFPAEGLTVVITDLLEQEFRLDDLADTLCSAYQASRECSIAIFGIRTPYHGDVTFSGYRKMENGGGVGEITIRNFEGSRPLIILMFGEKTVLKTYTEKWKSELAKADVECWEAYYEHLQTDIPEMLTFGLIDETLKNENSTALDGLEPIEIAGTNNLKEVEKIQNNGFRMQYDGKTTICPAMEGECQIALYAECGEEQQERYGLGEPILLRKTEDRWVNAEALEKDAFRVMELQYLSNGLRGAGKEGDILSSSVKSLYERVRVNTKNLSSDTIYYLGLPIQLMNAAVTDEIPSGEILELNADINEYAQAAEDLPEGNFQKADEEKQKSVEECLSRVMSLDTLLNRMDNVYLTERRNMPEYMTQMIDLIIEIKEK